MRLLDTVQANEYTGCSWKHMGFRSARDVPPHWAKFAPLLDDAVHVADDEQQLRPVCSVDGIYHVLHGDSRMKQRLLPGNAQLLCRV